jgi:hypothetical protein
MSVPFFGLYGEPVRFWKNLACTAVPLYPKLSTYAFAASDSWYEVAIAIAGSLTVAIDVFPYIVQLLA